MSVCLQGLSLDEEENKGGGFAETKGAQGEVKWGDLRRGVMMEGRGGPATSSPCENSDIMR